MAAPSSTEDLAEEPDAAEWPDSPQASSSRAPNTDVAEAKQAVAELEQEKQGLTVQVKALGDYLDKEVTLEEVKDAGVRGLGKNPTDEEVKARFAKLEDRLSSLHEELRRARRTLAIAMQNETQARQVGGASTPLTVAAVQSLGSKAEGTQMLLRQAAFATRGREYFQKACSETRESVGTDVEARIKRTVQERSQSKKDALCMLCGASEDLAEEPDAAEWPDSPQASSSRAPNTDVAEAKQAVALAEQRWQEVAVQVKALGDYLDKEVTLEEVKDA
eukprot:Rhum_TRINITY_DN14580_c0_g1::Rhum_TRINITY_DN14580_c0_g1_i8::g.93573::m.93573